MSKLHLDGALAAQSKLKASPPKAPRANSEDSTFNDDETRKSALTRLHNFAKQDSQSSIIEINKYPQFMDSKHEPHVQSSGSIVLKEPSVMSSS